MCVCSARQRGAAQNRETDGRRRAQMMGSAPGYCGLGSQVAAAAAATPAARPPRHLPPPLHQHRHRAGRQGTSSGTRRADRPVPACLKKVKHQLRHRSRHEFIDRLCMMSVGTPARVWCNYAAVEWSVARWPAGGPASAPLRAAASLRAIAGAAQCGSLPPGPGA